jgi:hypothetical protein
VCSPGQYWKTTAPPGFRKARAGRHRSSRRPSRSPQRARRPFGEQPPSHQRGKVRLHPQWYWLTLAAPRRSGPFMLIEQWDVHQVANCNMIGYIVMRPVKPRIASTTMSSSVGASAIRSSQSGSMRWYTAPVTRVTRASRSSVKELPRRSIRPSV